MDIEKLEVLLKDLRQSGRGPGLCWQDIMELVAAAKRAEELEAENARLRRKNTTLRNIAKNERRLRKLLQRAYGVCIHYANTTTAPYARLSATELCEEIQEALK